MTLATSPQTLQQHLDAYAAEIAALVNGKKSAAPKARKHLQVLKEMCQRLRSEVLAATKPEKIDTAVAPEDVAAAAATILELAPSPPEDTIPSPTEDTQPPKPKRVRKASKKSI